MNFLDFDVETTNSDYLSICQIGIAFFSNGRIIDTYETLIDPFELNHS